MIDRDDRPRQYLAWGGESGDTYQVIAVEQIRKDLAQELASGTRNWTRFALLGPRSDYGTGPARRILEGWPETWPVEVRSVERSVDDNDYVHERFILVTPFGEVMDEFGVTHDGRA